MIPHKIVSNLFRKLDILPLGMEAVYENKSQQWLSYFLKKIMAFFRQRNEQGLYNYLMPSKIIYSKSMLNNF